MRFSPLLLSLILFLSPVSFALPQRSTLLRRVDNSPSNSEAADGIGGEEGADAEYIREAEAAANADQFPPTSSPFGFGSFFPEADDTSRSVELKRRTAAVKNAFLHSWQSYNRLGLPNDEIRPVTGKAYSTRNGWGASALDGLSTAIIMDLAEPVNQIINHIKSVDFTKSNTQDPISLFETTIRYLGGLISGYDLLKTTDRKSLVKHAPDIEILLKQAKTLANKLSIAFNTRSGIPYNDINPTMTGPADQAFNMETSTANLAQAGTLILEWSRLADLTNNATYKNLSHTAETFLLFPTSWGPDGPLAKKEVVEPFPGLVGFDIFIKNGTFKNGYGSWSGGADSFYEYLLKMWLYNASSGNRIFRDRWIKAVHSSSQHLRSHPVPKRHNQDIDIAFMQAWRADKSKSNFSQHLTCFDGGNILLGAQALDWWMLELALDPPEWNNPLKQRKGYRYWADMWQDFVTFGLELVEGCHHLYNYTATGIGPEVFSWNEQDDSSKRWPYFKIEKPPVYILRPEVMESYYYAYRITGDQKYQDWAWDAFQAFEKYCKTTYGYSAIRDVNLWLPPASDRATTNATISNNWLNEQESFWFAETLKYSYLIQVDDDEEWQVPRGGLTGGRRWRAGLPGRKRIKWVFNTEAHPIRVFGNPQ